MVNNTVALRHLMLAVLLGQFFASDASAVGGGSFTLAPGEIASIVIGSTYREIRICNDLQSAGELVVVVADHEPFSLAPGLCKSQHGDHIALRNESSAIVFCVVEVLGKHQS